MTFSKPPDSGASGDRLDILEAQLALLQPMNTMRSKASKRKG